MTECNHYQIKYGGWYNSLLGGTGQSWATNASYGGLDHYQTAISAATSNIVTNWQVTQTGGLMNYLIYGGAGEPETDAQRAAREAGKQAAKARAEKLLFTILTPAQVKRYTDDGCFEQEVGGRIYRLHANSRSGNVVLLDETDGKPKFKYCAHPSDAHETPIPDVLLSQLLMLKSNEAEFLRIANRTALR